MKDADAELLVRLRACREARDWCATQPSLAAAWQECPRGDWLLWLAARLDVDRRVLVRAACACARLALPHVPAGELRPLRAIEAAEAWARGEATLGEVCVAADAAVHAADAAADAAACATYAAVHAADAAADAAACATYAAADAARAAARAAAHAAHAAADAAYAAHAAHAAALARCADIVRSFLPTLPGGAL